MVIMVMVIINNGNCNVNSCSPGNSIIIVCFVQYCNTISSIGKQKTFEAIDLAKCKETNGTSITNRSR